jgi:hypothetical protein
MAACSFGLAEIFGYAAWHSGGYVNLWRDSPDPVFAFLFSLFHGAILPCAMLWLLWSTSQNTLAFVLRAVAAPMAFIGALYALAVTFVLVNGSHLTGTELLLGYGPISLVCILFYLSTRVERHPDLHVA